MDSGSLWHLGQAGILGLVQGLTEFIPISSSGHLIIAREFLRMEDPGNFFDAILHLATLLAVLIYFRREWWQMLTVARHKGGTKNVLAADRRLGRLILLATIPGLVTGYLGNGWIAHNFRSLLPVAILMVGMGIIYLLIERKLKPPKQSRPLTNFSALNIGLAQAIAIIPGISRSGATMLGGRYMGLTRENAARFSFMMAAPVIAVAGGYGLYQAIAGGMIGNDYWFWLTSFVFSAISGLLVIRWLLKFFQKHSLDNFAYYLIVVGSGLIIYYFLR